MTTTIRLTEEVEHRLAFLAEKTGRTKTFYLREIITKGITDMEDYYLADSIMEGVRKGVEKIYTSDAVRKGLGLED
jgi:RHH-type rel operon transcriptional repressor/antitoxin RelB